MEQVEVFQLEPTPTFNKRASFLIKKRKYNHLPKQIVELSDNLRKGVYDNSEVLLTHSDIPTPYDVYKMRLANPDANEGKSGGYRIIYMVKTAHKIIVLLTIYSKSDKENITDKEIEALVTGYFMSQLPEEED
jgi:mRNA-degrading endonuclease RelE of RelBE toxin-antitoxin system